MPKTNFTTVDEYIDTFPENVQAILQKVRATIRRPCLTPKKRSPTRSPRPSGTVRSSSSAGGSSTTHAIPGAVLDTSGDIDGRATGDRVQDAVSRGAAVLVAE